MIVLRQREPFEGAAAARRLFVYKDDGCTARYTIRFRPEGA
jgi:hypothetical protein